MAEHSLAKISGLSVFATMGLLLAPGVAHASGTVPLMSFVSWFTIPFALISVFGVFLYRVRLRRPSQNWTNMSVLFGGLSLLSFVLALLDYDDSFRDVPLLGSLIWGGVGLLATVVGVVERIRLSRWSERSGDEDRRADRH